MGCGETPGGDGGDGGTGGVAGDGGTGGDGGVGGDPIADLVDKIRTEVDPAFVYEYEQTKFVPPTGKTLLIVGQNLEDINEYTADFPHEPAPGGWMAYWGVPSTDGLWNTEVNEWGYTQNHQELVHSFPHSVLQSALWMVGKWDIAKKTAEGEYDHVIRDFSTWAKTVNCPIYLRIGYEFDGPHNELEPSEYVTAYKQVVDIIREEDVSNVAFVWHSYAAPPWEGHPLESWYPGDDYVDWVAVSLFGHMYGSDLGPDAKAVFDFAKTHKKPVMVAESSPVYGIFDGDLRSWDTWFVNYFSLAYEKNIKAISFVNVDWTQYRPDVPPDWQNARLQNNETVAEAWFMETAKDRYLKQSPQLFEQLGFSP
ncbi:MAG: hypothetical protein IZT58_15980 [Actinobacteria bacterium]|nr:hypothetical protein [Actinomycetota bacterium]